MSTAFERHGELLRLARILADELEVHADVAGTAICAGPGKHYLRTLLQINNEVTFGATKRSGTHRENAHLAPGGLSSMLRGEAFGATSCREAGAADQVPPLGTGAPPCLQQEPYRLAGGKPGIVPRLDSDTSRP